MIPALLTSLLQDFRGPPSFSSFISGMNPFKVPVFFLRFPLATHLPLRSKRMENKRIKGDESMLVLKKEEFLNPSNEE